MKYLTLCLFVFCHLSSFSQSPETTPTPDSVSFIVKVDISDATKDGIYLNGYVVNISYKQAKRLNGKTIRVSGKVTIIKGLKDDTSRQGRSEDTRHIESPKIEIIDI